MTEVDVESTMLDLIGKEFGKAFSDAACGVGQSSDLRQSADWDHEIGILTDANATCVARKSLAAHNPATCWWCINARAAD